MQEAVVHVASHTVPETSLVDPAALDVLQAGDRKVGSTSGRMLAPDWTKVGSTVDLCVWGTFMSS